MEVKVYSGNYEVINSGIAFLRYGEKLEFLIANLRFQFSVEQDEQSTQKMRWQVNTDEEGKAYMEVKYFNLNHALFNMLNNAIPLARIANRELTFQFSVTSLNKRDEEGVHKEDAMVIYSWCLEKKKPNTDA